MSLTNEDLLAISNVVKAQIQPVENRTRNLELLLENQVIPRLQNIEACYASTSRRYISGIEQLDSIQTDTDILKKVVAEHSEILRKIS